MKQWKNILNKVPLSIFIKSENCLEFINKMAEEIIIQNHTEENQECLTQKDLIKEEKKEGINKFEILKEIIEQNNNISLHQFIFDENSRKEFSNSTRFKYTLGTEEKVYEVSFSEIKFFNMKKCLAFYIKDVTSSEELIKQELREKNTKIYIASVTHDLRTPINGIVGMLDCIKVYTQDLYIRECIETASNSSEMLLLLIRDILDLSQFEANKIRINIEQVNIIAMINESVKLFSKDFQLKNLELKLDFSNQRELFINTDKNRYKQILCNLISNALKYTTNGFIRIKVKFNENTNSLKTSIYDTGVGIAKDDQDKLFNLFGKLNSNSQLNPNGIGLGLTICQRLSKLLGGDIKLKSELGVGSKFTFIIKSKDEFGIENLDLCRNPSKRLGSSLIHLNQPEELKNLNFKECECSKLLFVDDNSINLLVLTGYIKGLKINVDIVLLNRQLMD